MPRSKLILVNQPSILPKMTIIVEGSVAGWLKNVSDLGISEFDFALSADFIFD